MYRHYKLALAAFAVLCSTAGATDDCNPIEETDCDPDTGLSTSTYSVDFTNGADDDNWESVGGGDVNYTSSGAEFIITEKGDSPTLQTAWYIFFGRVEVHMKAASGTGIVSCVVLLSDDYDEVDWEWLGGYPDEVQTNYFGKGDSTSSGRSTTESVDDSQDTSHNYTLYWTEEALSWYIDGSLIRTLNYADASSGDEYPQTPSRVKLGIWAGGDSDNAEGTISWAGGETDYDEGPFTMVVESVEITNFNPAENYTYSDQTGDYTSIEFDAVSDSDGDTDTTESTSTAKPTTSTAALTTSVVEDSEATKAVVTTESPVTTTEVPAATESANQGSDSNSSNGNSDEHNSGTNDSGRMDSGKTMGNSHSHSSGKSSGNGIHRHAAKHSGNGGFRSAKLNGKGTRHH